MTAHDPPIIHGPNDNGKLPTGNWYIVHIQSPHCSTTMLSGHMTRAGAEREVAMCKEVLPWAGRGEWIIKPTSEYVDPMAPKRVTK